MSFQIIGKVDHHKLFCSGSFTKLLTTYVVLRLLAEKYDLLKEIDNPHFLKHLCKNKKSKQWLNLFQSLIKKPFTLHDVCSYYLGLPYTFDVSTEEIEAIELGFPFKHHSILTEEDLLSRCMKDITLIYPPHSKFHYSEVAIVFLGYLIEQCYETSFEVLYNYLVIEKFKLEKSLFSRIKPPDVFIQDLSYRYDYPSIAILDHGYFCYSNGFFTCLEDMRKLLNELVHDDIFNLMSNPILARAASLTIMNGLSVEMRYVKKDLLLGYEGLSYSGCNIWAYSTQHKKGYLTFTDNEEESYKIYEAFGYDHFDSVPDYTHKIYRQFKQNYQVNYQNKPIPLFFQGFYQRVYINTSSLDELFEVGSNFIIIRNPDRIKYEIVYANGTYRIKGKDAIPGIKVGFVRSKKGFAYLYQDGTLYKKVSDP